MTSTAVRLQPTTTPVRPALRVLDGGRAPARVAQRAQFRRRRIAVGLALASLLLLLVAAAATRVAGGDPSPAAGGSSPTSAAATGAAGVAAPATVVVQPGDTLWTIAAAVAPGVDVRVTVDRLVALNGDTPIVVGQQLELPSS